MRRFLIKDDSLTARADWERGLTAISYRSRNQTFLKRRFFIKR